MDSISHSPALRCYEFPKPDWDIGHSVAVAANGSPFGMWLMFCVLVVIYPMLVWTQVASCPDKRKQAACVQKRCWVTWRLAGSVHQLSLFVSPVQDEFYSHDLRLLGYWVYGAAGKRSFRELQSRRIPCIKVAVIRMSRDLANAAARCGCCCALPKQQ